MSATNETKVAKKRGRPKKVKETPVVPAPQDTKELARKAVEEIMSQATEAARGIELESPVSIEGARPGASSYDAVEDAQEDYLPGTRVTDIQMVPTRAYDENIGRVRRLGLPDQYHYCWVHPDKVTSFRVNGYKHVQYNGGSQSGLAEGGFNGTGMYEKTFDNHVRNGDMFLMWIDNRRFEQIERDEIDYRLKLEQAVEDQIHNDGYRRGIRTFKEVGGVTLYN